MTVPRRTVHLPVPGDLDAADRRALQQRDVTEVPEQFVLELSEANLVGRAGWVFHQGKLVEDIWQEAGFPAPTLVPRTFLEPRTRLAGTTVSLLMPWSPNYYHWTAQVVPRVLAVREVRGGSLRGIDHWLVPGNAPRFVGEWLDALGVPAKRRVEVVGTGQTFSSERLVVASIPGRNRWVSAEDVQKIRAAAPGAGSLGIGRSRRLLIRREASGRRIALNGDAVAAALEERGFEVVDSAAMPLAEEAETFRAADVVVGVHGAGLTNLVFCREGATVVELAPHGLVYPTFVKLAAAAGVRHNLVVGREPRLPRLLRFPDTRADLVVDIERLLSVIDQLDAELSARRPSPPPPR